MSVHNLDNRPWAYHLQREPAYLKTANYYHKGNTLHFMWGIHYFLLCHFFFKLKYYSLVFQTIAFSLPRLLHHYPHFIKKHQKKSLGEFWALTLPRSMCSVWAAWCFQQKHILSERASSDLGTAHKRQESPGHRRAFHIPRIFLRHPAKIPSSLTTVCAVWQGWHVYSTPGLRLAQIPRWNPKTFLISAGLTGSQWVVNLAATSP